MKVESDAKVEIPTLRLKEGEIGDISWQWPFTRSSHNMGDRIGFRLGKERIYSTYTGSQGKIN